MQTLEIISWIFLALGLLTGLAILIDIIRHPQPMSIMNVTWPVFWFMMQIAMVIGFATAYPANWWLINRGIKHDM